jgi:hypothetical protein
VWLVGSDGEVTGAVLMRIARDLTMSVIAVALVCGVAGLLLTALGIMVPKLVREPATPVNPVARRSSGFVPRQREE